MAPRASSSLALGVFALAFGLAPVAGATAPTGWKRVDVPATGTYALRYIPPTLDQTAAAPAVMFLHGAGTAGPEYWLDMLPPIADSLRCVLILPKALNVMGFGVGKDDVTISESLRVVGGELSLDKARTSIAGHSAGGAYALVLAYAARTGYSAVFTLSAPFRQVLSLADPDYTAPIRMYYGTEDPNYQGGSYLGLYLQWQRLGVPAASDIEVGYGHSVWPQSTLADGFAFLVSQRYATPGGCFPTDTRLCVLSGRFAIEASWRDFQGGTGVARIRDERSRNTGLLTFFNPDNWEVMVKVLDGCALNARYWVFVAAATNVEYTITVTDMRTASIQRYTNPLGLSAPAITDTSAFATCP